MAGGISDVTFFGGGSGGGDATPLLHDTFIGTAGSIDTRVPAPIDPGTTWSTPGGGGGDYPYEIVSTADGALRPVYDGAGSNIWAQALVDVGAHPTRIEWTFSSSDVVHNKSGVIIRADSKTAITEGVIIYYQQTATNTGIFAAIDWSSGLGRGSSTAFNVLDTSLEKATFVLQDDGATVTLWEKDNPSVTRTFTLTSGAGTLNPTSSIVGVASQDAAAKIVNATWYDFKAFE